MTKNQNETVLKIDREDIENGKKKIVQKLFYMQVNTICKNG